jgi:hypothetical protein
MFTAHTITCARRRASPSMTAISISGKATGWRNHPPDLLLDKRVAHSRV